MPSSISVAIKIPTTLKLFLLKSNAVVLMSGVNARLFFISKSLKVTIEKNKLILHKNFSRTEKKSLLFFYSSLWTSFAFSYNFLLKARATLKGVGYKVSQEKVSPKIAFLYFKLGYSHPIFVKIPKKLNVKVTSPSNFFFSSYDPNVFFRFYSLVTTLKPKDCYKGKGLILNKKTFVLKTGKGS